MIICEGMDGTGKSSLARALSEELNIPIHERAATSTGGPVQNLYDWAVADVDTWADQEFSIYDRHPLISEYVYGPITRRFVDPRFHTAEARALVKKLAYGGLVIFCDPGDNEILHNVRRDPNAQWGKIAGHELELIYTYRTIFTYWQVPMKVIRYDYRDRGQWQHILEVCKIQQATHERTIRGMIGNV